MKLFNAGALHPKRVRIFLSEKGIEIPLETLDFAADEQKTPEYLAINSLGEVPSLQLDDGRVLCESTAICRYLEEIHPETPLMGLDAYDRGLVEMWSRRLELGVARAISEFALHTSPFFAQRINQIPAYAELQAASAQKHWQWLEKEMKDGRPYVAGERFSHADIIGMFAFVLADMFDQSPPAPLAHVRAWEARLKARPSWGA